jgi:hypothetical protein
MSGAVLKRQLSLPVDDVKVIGDAGEHLPTMKDNTAAAEKR